MTRVLLEELRAGGWEVEIVERTFSRNISSVGRFAWLKVVKALVFWARVKVRTKRSDCDVVVYFGTTRPFSFIVDFVSTELLRSTRTPVVNYVHTVGYDALAARGRLWRGLVRRHLTCFQETVVLTESLRADIEAFVPLARMSVIGNAVSTPPAVDPTTQSSNGRKKVAYLSNLLAEKGADVFTDVAISLSQARTDVDFALAGAVSDQAFAAEQVRKVKAAGLEDRVRFCGPVFGDRKWEFLAEADLLLFPTTYRYEAQPLVILEALSVGTPVVSSRIGGITTTLRDGETGVLIDATDRRRTEIEVAALLDDEPRLQAMSLAALKDAADRFSRHAYREAWSQVLCKVVR